MLLTRMCVGDGDLEWEKEMRLRKPEQQICQGTAVGKKT